MPAEAPTKKSPDDVQVEIDGVLYRAGPATGKVMRKASAYADEIEDADLTDQRLKKVYKRLKAAHKDGADDKVDELEKEVLRLRKEMKQQNDAYVGVVFKQAALLLVAEDGKHPSVDKLEDTLEFQDARLLTTKLNPRGADPKAEEQEEQEEQEEPDASETDSEA